MARGSAANKINSQLTRFSNDSAFASSSMNFGVTPDNPTFSRQKFTKTVGLREIPRSTSQGTFCGLRQRQGRTYRLLRRIDPTTVSHRPRRPGRSSHAARQRPPAPHRHRPPPPPPPERGEGIGSAWLSAHRRRSGDASCTPKTSAGGGTGAAGSPLSLGLEIRPCVTTPTPNRPSRGRSVSAGC